MNKIIAIFLGVSLLPQVAVAATPEIKLHELFGKISDAPGPFVLHLHCGDGRQSSELLKRDGLVVQGLDASRENVAAARRNPAFQKKYGKRITFNWFDGTNISFIDNCVNLILATSPVDVSSDELLRVLAPGGIAVFSAFSSDGHGN